MKKYLITSQDFYSDDVSVFSQRLEEQVRKHKPDFVLFRDKKTPHYKELAGAFMKVMQKFQEVKALIHDDVELARDVDADGVHLPSYSIHKIVQAQKENLEVVVSTHTQEEVVKMEKIGVDYVTYSPIFFTPNKGEPKGIDNLLELLKKTDMKIFALGGIVTKKEVEMVEKTNVYGFASIRYFYG